jgi:beta-xylosidase
MTLVEKLQQLGSTWPGAEDAGGDVAPMQETFEGAEPFDKAIVDGLGHITRPFGTAPLEPDHAQRRLVDLQGAVVAANRFGIPAIAHEECLTGFTAWKATVYPTPMAWAASWNSDLIRLMGTAIGNDLARAGIHQGLAPVMDVVRDYRWGRVEETLGEDPYLVAVLGTAYTRGLESADVVATLKHFAGYAGSRAARNHAPVSIGRREFLDTVLPPFEMALREGGARSVMHSYAAVDGVPPAADPWLLTDLLRDAYGFTGVVVSDYFGISFLESFQQVAGSPAEAAHVALTAGVDVELPTVRCYGRPLVDGVRRGDVSEDLVDRAVGRVLHQKGQLGLLDPEWDPEPEALHSPTPLDFDPPHVRALARTIAERSVVLADNPAGALPVEGSPRLAVVGPCADEVRSLMGCYAFPTHVGVHHPDTDLGIEVPTVLDAVRTEFPDSPVAYAAGCPVQDEDRRGFDEAVGVAGAADLCIAVLGDVAGLFGRGTSGEGCDAEDLRLPGVQASLLDSLLDTGTPVVLVLVGGRPYALGDVVHRLAAVVVAFFPGEEGAGAVAGALSGRVNPSGKLPVQLPRRPGGQPATYLAPPLARLHAMSSVDPTPCFAFGHGLSYTSFTYGELTLDGVGDTDADPPRLATDGEVTVSCVVTNTGDRAGSEVVQLYLRDPVAAVARPERQLAGFARVELEAGRSARVSFVLHADRTAFTGPSGERMVEPGDIHLLVGASSTDIRCHRVVRLAGPTRVVGPDRVLTSPVSTALVDSPA